MIGWPACTISANPSDMTTGENLRLWREARGLTLEEAADKVETLAIARGVPRESKKVPRTHASLSRWETGKVDVKEIGLELIALAYGVTKEQIRRPPPEAGSPPTRSVEVPEPQADAVAAFLEAMKKAG